jgi:nitronate monooxygenase
MTAAEFFDRLPIPIIQAPMAGASSVAMAIAVSRAGAFGSIAAAALGPAEIGAAAAEVRAGTDAAFQINLLVPGPGRPAASEVDAALARLKPWYEEAGVPLPEAPNVFAQDLDAQIEAIVQARPAVASFAFDLISEEQVGSLKAAGCLVVGTATTVAEARAWQVRGADAVCAQGFEAGGHRGHFLADVEASLVGTLALVATIRAAVDLPVIAAGGIMDGHGVAAVLALGAAAAQMGTAFLLADDTAISGAWRSALEHAPEEATRLTRAFTGRHARGVENRLMREMRAIEAEVPAYPVQNRLTQPLRAAAARAGDAELLSLWAGQGVKLARPGRSGELVQRWWEEARAASRRLAARTSA